MLWSQEGSFSARSPDRRDQQRRPQRSWRHGPVGSVQGVETAQKHDCQFASWYQDSDAARRANCDELLGRGRLPVALPHCERRPEQRAVRPHAARCLGRHDENSGMERAVRRHYSRQGRCQTSARQAQGTPAAVKKEKAQADERPKVSCWAFICGTKKKKSHQTKQRQRK